VHLVFIDPSSPVNKRKTRKIKGVNQSLFFFLSPVCCHDKQIWNLADWFLLSLGCHCSIGDLFTLVKSNKLNNWKKRKEKRLNEKDVDHKHVDKCIEMSLFVFLLSSEALWFIAGTMCACVCIVRCGCDKNLILDNISQGHSTETL